MEAQTLNFETVSVLPSSNIRSVWYEPTLHVLAVEFHRKDYPTLRGSVYVYRDIPTAYVDMLTAEADKVDGSTGKVFNALVRSNADHQYALALEPQDPVEENPWEDLNDELTLDTFNAVVKDWI